MKLPEADMDGASPQPAQVDEHKIYFDGKFLSTPIYDRAKLQPGNRMTGPAIVTEMDATTVVLLSPACASFDHYRNFEIRGDAFVKLVSELPGVTMTIKGVV